MSHVEKGIKSTCVCNVCLKECNLCLGTNSVLDAKDIAQMIKNRNNFEKTTPFSAHQERIDSEKIMPSP